MLAQGNYSVEELAAMLDLRASTVSHHLARLTEAGLVSGRTESYYNVYRLEKEALESLAQRIFSQETLGQAAAEVDMDAYDRKVAADFTAPDGRLKTLPAQRKKLDAVLRYVVRAFEPGLRYPENQVNDILSRSTRIRPPCGGSWWAQN